MFTSVELITKLPNVYLVITDFFKVLNVSSSIELVAACMCSVMITESIAEYVQSVNLELSSVCSQSFFC